MSRTQDRNAATPLLEHISELRTHLVWVGIFVIGGAALSYVYRDLLLKYLQAPLGDTLYYTSPTGGIAFLFKMCIVGGFIFALPVILFHAFRFVEPVMDEIQRKGTTKYVIWSFILAYCGIAFAYFFSLPSALTFLTSFGGDNVKSLIDAGQYFNFALAYVGGFAFLFQLPLVILFINRIKPLKPSVMMKFQKWIILASYIVAAMLTPTPDPINQTIMAVPIILLYEISIVLIFFLDRKLKKQQARLAKAALKLEQKNTKRDHRGRTKRGNKTGIPATVTHAPFVERPTILSAKDLADIEDSLVPKLSHYNPVERIAYTVDRKRKAQSTLVDGFVPRQTTSPVSVVTMKPQSIPVKSSPIRTLRPATLSMVAPRMSPRMSRPEQVVSRQQPFSTARRPAGTMIGNDFC